MKRFFAVGAFVTTITACSSGGLVVGTDDGGTSPGDGGVHTGTACTHDSDCGANGLCGFPESDACLAHGSCFERPGVECNVYAPGCACDGTTIDIACNGLPDGYASAPLRHAGACSDGSAGDAGGGISPCTTNAECASGSLCGFLASDACHATGTCMRNLGALCDAILPGCACDGTTINTICSGLPNGYTTKPLAHTGLCTDAGHDAGGACTTDSDCGHGSICGFATSDMCTAKGTCFPNTGPLCNAVSPGCACDGTTINTICSGLPNGYTTKPLAHAGTC